MTRDEITDREARRAVAELVDETDRLGLDVWTDDMSDDEINAALRAAGIDPATVVRRILDRVEAALESGDG